MAKILTWTCPYCNFAQVLSDELSDLKTIELATQQDTDNISHVVISSRICANPECEKLNLVLVGGVFHNDRDFIKKNYWELLPRSMAKPQPAYIPSALKEDYEEACLIRDLSPKASATLARRCLQGMIRDFYGISAKTLDLEIKKLRSGFDDGSLKENLSAELLDAIDHVRKIGNIGAHMEADINVIIEVDPDEAQILIGLIEMLFEEWYVSRFKRKEHLASLKSIADSKAAQKKPKQ